MGIIKVLNPESNAVLKKKYINNIPKRHYINPNGVDKTPKTDTVELSKVKDKLTKTNDTGFKTTNTSDGKINISTISDGEYYNIAVNRGKNAASSSCHIDNYYDEGGHSPKGYIDNDGNVKGLYVSSIVSTGGGMGTEAMKQTVLLSQKLGQKGKVFLEASTLDKRKGSPIPFYTKLGFLPVDEALTPQIQKGMNDFANNGKYTGPTRVMMYLPLDKIDALLAK